MADYNIVDKEYLEDDDAYHVWLELTEGAETYQLDIIVPFEDEIDLIAFLDAHVDELWEAALRHKERPDIHYTISHRRLLKAILLVILDEINILREIAGLPPRTPAQIEPAIRVKLEEIGPEGR